MGYKVFKAHSLEEAWQLQAQYPSAVYIGGGTDMLPRLNQGLEQPPALICLENIAGLAEISFNGEEFRIGALCRLTDLATTALLRDYVALQYAASRVASPQIRNQATIGGNLLQENRCMYFNQAVSWRRVDSCFKLGGNCCYQYKNSPECVALYQSDLAPVLIAQQARLLLAGPKGQREITLPELYLKAGLKAKEAAEILLAIIIPRPKHSWRSAYVRETIRGSFDFPLLSCGVMLETEAGRIESLSICLGSAGVSPAILDTTAFKGQSISLLNKEREGLLQAGRKLIAPFRDTRVDTPTRRALAQMLLEKALNQVCQGLE